MVIIYINISFATYRFLAPFAHWIVEAFLKNMKAQVPEEQDDGRTEGSIFFPHVSPIFALPIVAKLLFYNKVVPTFTL